MATPRKLSQEQEREVALAYLCGVGTDKIQEKYSVSDATTRSSIIGKRSREWNDPLVEFYRETNPQNKDRNAAHLYLAFTDVPQLPRGELVDLQKDQSVRDIVEESLYRPGIDQIVKWTALDHYVSPKASLGWATIKLGEVELGRGNPYEALLHVIVGSIDEEQIVRTALTKRLHEEYQNGGPYSLQNVFPKVAYDIVLKIKEGGLGITPTKKKIIEEVLLTLTDRERQILGMRFGLDGCDGPKDIDQIGQSMEVTRERIRQIEAKAIRKLRHPARVKKVQYMTGLFTEQDAQAHLDAMKVEAERDKWKHELYSEIEQEVLGHIARDHSLKRRVDEEATRLYQDRLNHSVEELELSIRTANCLSNQGIKTIGDLAKWTEVDLLRTKNFGRKSLMELKQVLEPYNIKLARGE